MRFLVADQPNSTSSKEANQPTWLTREISLAREISGFNPKKENNDL